MTLHFANSTARRIFLAKQGLSGPPGAALSNDGLLDLIRRIGFVQVDSISTVERAHNMILFSRNQTFRPGQLTELIEEDRALFEHWTHDASIIPTDFYRYWKHFFLRKDARIRERWTRWRGEDYDSAFAETLAHITENGPVMAREMKSDEHKSGGWWQWHPNKTALEYFWQTGKLSIHSRRNFQKVYDLSERVIPDHHREAEVSHEAFIDWACRSALERLGFATHGEIAAFWAMVTPEEAKTWIADNRDELIDVAIETVDGRQRPSYALPGLSPDPDDWPEPPGRVRVLSPFDPVLRDRNRAERLFGFSYRIEIFVPEPRRQYGYYVFPLMEGERMIGRIDMKADRKAGTLNVRKLWWEPKVRASAGRMDKLASELARIAAFAGVGEVVLADDWLDA
ncbi:winged helix-turn-helix domain-containing protein [Pseudohoeflea suaedae]|uniref:Winged helix-turn-helix domain-containing protein n=1 Tax=Pseudohoeflea suaedae TaxID=877384 RepID=A0A4R5PNV4_9HYPH|nr:winged helix-turn-helix domain-containing protein [Pseudohoeflea suaedae]TDH38669.1 winged helix-turn-helix domain-containing protein [Pseudohoeflea suaedae]